MVKGIRKLQSWIGLSRQETEANQKKIQALRYGPLQAVLVTAGVFFLATVITSALLSIYPISQGWDQTRTNAWLNNSAVVQFFLFLISSLITAAGIYGFLRWRKQAVALIGVTRPKIRDAIYGVLTVIPYFAALVVVISLVGQFIPSVDVNQQQEIFTAPAAGPSLILVFIALVVLPPLLEEFVFRGLLFTGIRKKLSFLWTTIIVSVIFGSLHLSASSDGPLWIAAIDTALLSYFLCYLREKTGSIWAGVTLHFVKNFIAFMALFVIR